MGEEKLPIPLRRVVWKVTLGYLVVALEPARLCCSERRLYFSLKCFPLYHTTPLRSLLTAEVLFPCIKQVYLDWNLHLCVLIVLRKSLSFPPFIVKVIMFLRQKDFHVLHRSGDRLVSCWSVIFKYLVMTMLWISVIQQIQLFGWLFIFFGIFSLLAFWFFKCCNKQLCE